MEVSAATCGFMRLCAWSSAGAERRTIGLGGEGALQARGGAAVESMAAGLDDEVFDEGVDEDGIGGGGVVTESRPAVFGASNHAEDAQQPAHMRVGLAGPREVQAHLFGLALHASTV
jgi:hypothetical protein